MVTNNMVVEVLTYGIFSSIHYSIKHYDAIEIYFTIGTLDVQL